ncbi:SCO family protein [Dongia soli]|uniref:SCO family protein n=1 Tax=Dongia soli TaxID=600628 RepID=A0ABU5E6Z0_9PROT|nr:SCO family protein [Dongia soli]MDY0881405.1 SCO family protein [Dongia soli]
MPKSGMARGLVIACLVAILGLCGLVSWKLYQRSVGAEAGSVAIGGPFSLTDQDGKHVTEADLKGKLSLIYFGYTFCPDACPTALGTITAALNKMGADADQVTPVFITIDPERDTQQVMKEYASNFHPRLRALTGSVDEVTAAAHAYKIYFTKEGGTDPQNYLMNHSTLIYLMDRDGKYLAHFGPQATPDDIATEVRKYL